MGFFEIALIVGIVIFIVRKIQDAKWQAEWEQERRDRENIQELKKSLEANLREVNGCRIGNRNYSFPVEKYRKGMRYVEISNYAYSKVHAIAGELLDDAFHRLQNDACMKGYAFDILKG